MYTLEFTIKDLPKTSNAIMSWKIRMGNARKWRLKVVMAALGFEPKEPLKLATLELTRHSSRSPDYDGLVSSFKPIIDGLIDARIIENDRMTNIGAPKYSWQKAKHGAGHITVKVTEGLKDPSTTT